MKPVLIIARSARALAVLAERAGHEVHVLDAFNDEDTQAVARSCKRLDYFDGGFDSEQLHNAVQECVSENKDLLIVTGSGFEERLEQIAQLATVAPLLSNDTETIKKFNKPLQLIEYIEVNYLEFPLSFKISPSPDRAYLIKKAATSGGESVHWWDGVSTLEGTEYYFQAYIPGEVLSCVFLADGQRAEIVGFNRQRQNQQFEDRPFLYAGAITLNTLPESQYKVVNKFINMLTQKTGLKGLCGLDFIRDENGVLTVLEINPRPPATVELHDRDGELFSAHVSSFSQPLQKQANRSSVPGCRGHAILYADRQLTINAGMNWPEWVSDCPVAGSTLSKQSPVCSVFAEADEPDMVEQILEERLRQIESEIIRMQNAA